MQRRQFFQSALGAAIAASLPVVRAAEVLSKSSADFNAITGKGTQVTLPRSAVQELNDSLRGRLLLPENPDYEKARRVINPAIDKHPALIVQPSGVADIRHAVDFARANTLLVAVKGGGHSPGGKSTCDGGMMIDLSSFRHARVDVASKTAYIAGGSLLGDLDHEAQAFDLVTTAGTVSHTGVGGLTTGGGFGRLSRRFGLALDNVTGVDVVTADGQLRHANAEENPDLYWGVRGGGGNFGVVTSFEFQLHPMGRQVIGGDVEYPLSELRSLLKFYNDFSASAPDDLYLDFFSIAPAKGEGFVAIHACYSGPPGKADQVLAPLRKAGTVKSDGIKAIDYVAIQRSSDRTDVRLEGQYFKSGFTGGVSDKLIDAIMSGLKAHPERSTRVFMQQCGGAVSRVPIKSTAFAHRTAQQNLILSVTWPIELQAKPHIEYTRKFWSTLEPSTLGFYTNEVTNESQSILNANYGENYPRLLSVKKKYDPGNLFRLNANIDPSAPEARKSA